ncbi:MAG: hypothetical protein ABWW65_03500 [Thermoprotei archaeon]
MWRILPSMVKTEFSKITGYANGLLLYSLILTLLLLPLHPLELLLLAVILVYASIKLGKLVLFYVVSVVYAILSFTIIYAGFFFLAIYVLLLIAYSKRYYLLAGAIAISVVSYIVLGYSAWISDYYSVLAGYVAGESYEVVGIHLVVLSFVAVYTLMYTPYFRVTRIGSHIVGNPEAYPVALFILLLICAAVLLAFGNEYMANKYAELAYYSLVIGVILALKHTLEERERGSTE